jgi:hypothetical protein
MFAFFFFCLAIVFQSMVSSGGVRLAILVAALFAFFIFNDVQTPALDYPRLKDWSSAGRRFSFNNLSIFYRDSLDDSPSSSSANGKPTLLLLHGYPSSSFDWHPIWAKLAKRFRLIAPDFIGLGFSDKPQSHVYSLLEQADMVTALMASLDLHSAHVLSHDYGVSVAQELLARNVIIIDSSDTLATSAPSSEANVSSSALPSTSSTDPSTSPSSSTSSPSPIQFRVESVVFLNGGLFSESHRAMMIQKVLASPFFGPIVARYTAIFMTGTMSQCMCR